MNLSYLKRLEFDKVLETLSDFCVTYIGKDLALNLSPYNNKEKVITLLQETSEAVSLLNRNLVPAFFDISNIDIELKSLRSNMTLSAKSLLNLAKILKLSYDLKVFFEVDFIESSQYYILSDIFSKLYSNKSITDKIFSCILDENTIDDKASKHLQSIRKRQKQLELDIRNKLNDIIHSSSYSKYIQESIITIRNDRFVIPIKEEYRAQVKGFIHDISNAGSTVFIEPISVFEMNNELNQLKSLEDIEIEKILQQLTSLFYPYVESLQNDVKYIGKLDFIFAKAKYSKHINATTPVVNSDKVINLINARHPLISEDKIVPICINLGNSFSTLVITGPNTGGKTVALKTVGLLTCMACCGLNIPVDENSSIYVFDNIFADIGDNQSISDSLSTFSSHLLNIVDIIKHSTQNSLILVDELGSGTDPLEGANLAISILDYFHSMNCLTIATTHYQQLKQYALVTKGFQNASVEFDVSTLSPTYRLLIGVPGKSNAFEISKKLGLSDNIIYKAKSLMTTQQIDFEEVLKAIYDDKKLIESEKEEIQKNLAQISLLRKSLERDNENLNLQQQDLIADAKIQARDILLDAKQKATDIIKEMSNSSDIKQLNNLRNKLNDTIGNIKLDDTVDTNPCLSTDELKPNSLVFVRTLNKNGTIISTITKSNEVQVQVGNIKLNVNIKNLGKPKNIDDNSLNKSYTNSNFISKSKDIKTQINVIGLNVEEALFVVDKFLDDSSLAKLSNIRIIHGKGTGKLKDGIHQFLKKHPHVKSFRIGNYGEGEMGVTVVELN